MKLADRIIDLMAPFPGRPFRMQEIVKYANPRAADKRSKEATRKQARVVLEQLAESGSIEIRAREKNGGQALYIWKKREFCYLKSGSKSGRITPESLRLA
jgi:hypothetical protein